MRNVSPRCGNRRGVFQNQLAREGRDRARAFVRRGQKNDLRDATALLWRAGTLACRTVGEHHLALARVYYGRKLYPVSAMI